MTRVRLVALTALPFRHLQRLIAAAVVLAVAAAPAAHADFVKPPGSPYATGTDPYNVYAADLSRDGVPDLVTINGTTSDVSVLYQGPNGAFTPFGTYGLGGGTGPNLGATGDFNADGRTDIAVSNSGGGGGSNPYSVTILMHNSGDDDFTVAGYLSLGPTSFASGIATGDFNGDGKTDVAVSMHDTGQVAIFVRNPANNGFTTLAGSPFSVGGSGPGDIAVGDLDGTGGPDLAVVLGGSNQVSALLSQPGGGYTKPAGMPMSVGTSPQHVVIAPLNGDALPDVAVTNFGSDSVTVLDRVPAGGFTEAAGSPYTVGIRPAGLGVGDFNGQGGLDLAVADSGDDTIDILRNDGSGGFVRQAPVTTAPAVTPYGLTVGDFSGDGKPDIAYTALTTANVGLLDNTSGGPPTVITRPSVSGTTRPDHPLTCDVGTWAEVPTSFTTTWERGPASGGTGFTKVADGTTYTLTAGDVDAGIRCRVVATNGEGPSEAAVSDAVVVTANQAPVIRTFELVGAGVRGVQLHAFIDPQALATTYTISYGLAGTGRPQSTEPSRIVSPSPQLTIQNLSRGATYEFQLHATNATGTTDSAVLTVPLLAGTPNDRLYALDNAGQLVVMSPDGSNLHRVTLKGLGPGNISATNASISPDGTKVALVSHPCKRRAAIRPEPANLGGALSGPPVDSDCESTTRVDVANLDGSASYQIMDTSYAASHANPAWAPNGRMLAVVVDGYFSKHYNDGLYVASVPPAGAAPAALSRPQNVYRYEAVAWQPAGLILGATSWDRYQGVHYLVNPAWDTTHAIQLDGGLGEVINWPSGCTSLGACSRVAHIRPEPANLGGALVGDPVDDIGVAFANPHLDERCTACTLYSGSSHGHYAVHKGLPGVPGAFSPQGDELMLSSGVAVNSTTFQITRTLPVADKLRRVIGWTNCGDACVPAINPPPWSPSASVTVIAPGAGTTKITLKSGPGGTTYGATSVVSASRGFSLPKFQLRAAATTCAKHTIAAGASCTISVHFDGKTPGKVTARVFPNATSDPTASFEVKATGTGPTPKARKLTLSPKKLKTSAKTVRLSYVLTGAAKVSAVLVKAGARSQRPYANATTRSSRRRGVLTLKPNRKLAAGRYTLRVIVFTDRYQAPVKTVNVTAKK
jgi:hypothetical protein